MRKSFRNITEGKREKWSCKFKKKTKTKTSHINVWDFFLFPYLIHFAGFQTQGGNLKHLCLSSIHCISYVFQKGTCSTLSKNWLLRHFPLFLKCYFFFKSKYYLLWCFRHSPSKAIAHLNFFQQSTDMEVAVFCLHWTNNTVQFTPKRASNVRNSYYGLEFS